ncbi:MAG: hypothetical protein JWR51_2106 [Devosia sp.]|uniref:hypothetical protein n=1 Tax=Devosia sp. TaxID=1871048 RepID=UPI002609F3E0|nr:hypothetical protein [Devosia sp.]MDB5529003.1 hypothetical protein [Devosia sp.]
MLDHDKRVAYPLVIRYLSLQTRFEPALRDLGVRARAHPEKPAPPVLVALVAHLIDETFRVVSREPFGRRLARLPPDATLSFADLLLRLDEADAALGAFKGLYYKEFELDEGEWWTFGED